MEPRRFRRLPVHRIGAGIVALEATTFRSRLLGLAYLDGHEMPDDLALLIPRCHAVHTFGMRFELDLAWFDADGRIFMTDHGVPPGSFRRGGWSAAGVLELPVHLDVPRPDSVWPYVPQRGYPRRPEAPGSANGRNGLALIRPSSVDCNGHGSDPLDDPDPLWEPDDSGPGPA
jgi:uncharacterized membrane protein (UPF0127 family)